MTYENILNELKKVNLKEKFTFEFEKMTSCILIQMFKNTNKIHSTGALVIILMKTYELGSEKREYWHKVLRYFMTPEFARDKNTKF